MFTHDTFGLGHVRRCLHIINALAERAPNAAILFITGSPALHLVELLPRNADLVKIPTIVKTGSAGLKPSHLPVGIAEVSLLRERLITQTIAAFAPDVFLVDNFPLGSQRELLPALHEARRLGTQTILGLRDVVDAPDVVRGDWNRQGVYEVLDRHYDWILVYGMREVLDVAEAYAVSPRVAAKIRYCGYVTGNVPPRRPAAEVRRELGFGDPFVVATAGGGGDGFPLLKIFMEAMRQKADLPAMVVTGPLMPKPEREEIAAMAKGRPRLVIRDYVRDLPSYLGAADVVVSMCGYNVAAEILSVGARAIVVPRTWRYGEHLNRGKAGEEWEQMFRAQELARLGFVDLIEPHALDAATLIDRLSAMLSAPKMMPAVPVDLQGLDTVATHIMEVAHKQEGRHEAV